MSAVEGAKRLAGQWLLRKPALHEIYLRAMAQRSVRREYATYLKRCRPKAYPHLETFAYRPAISILMPVFNPERRWLEAAIDSVRGQTYSPFDLCICDDASSAAWVFPFLTSLAQNDPRLKVTRLNEHGGISRTLNRARTLANGEYLCFLDHDDFFVPSALAQIVHALQTSMADFLYADEDYVTESGEPEFAHLKPDWSPELLSNCMYLGHPMAIRTNLFDRIGGFRAECDGAQDYDLALRVAHETTLVQHVPEILYHWRQHQGSIARSTASKPRSHGAGLLAATEAVERKHPGAKVVEGPISNEYEVRYPSSAVHENRYLVFVEPHVKAQDQVWLSRLLAQAARPMVGICGAMVRSVDGRVIDGGVVIQQGVPYRLGSHEGDSALWKWLSFTREVGAVSGWAMAMRREVFQGLGGFDDAMGSLKAIDLCLRARLAGYAIMFESHAVLRAETPASEVPHTEASKFTNKWKFLVAGTDPFISPHLNFGPKGLMFANGNGY